MQSYETLILDVSLARVLTQVQLLEAPQPRFLKFERAKNVQILVRFTTTFEFHRKYL